MRQARLKAPKGWAVGHYHCMSRIVDRRKRMGPGEKEEFVRIMREYEAFCGVKVLTYCVMSNHFHILVEVPRRPQVVPTAEETVAKLERLSCCLDYSWVRQRLALYRQNGDARAEAEFLEGFYSRMWDVSWFIRLIKQRFSMWYNRRTGRKGTLWEERFKSVLVEGVGQALVTMAAYIDLNPVRAGLVEDPKDYRWSGYGEAMGGRRKAKEGLKAVVEALEGNRGPAGGWRGVLEAYRLHLFGRAEEREGAEGKGGRLGPSREAVLRVLEAKGEVVVADYLRCRVRYFVDGAVLGSRRFVDEVFAVHRRRCGEKRKSGARIMRGLEGRPLFALRDLRLNLFG